MVLNHVKAQKNLSRATHGGTRSWRFTPVRTAGRVLFKSGPDALAVAQASGLDNIRLERADDTGVNGGTGSYAVYGVDLSRP